MSEERRVAIITGAAQGIGRQTALTLAKLGYSLALNDLGSCVDVCRKALSLGVAASEHRGDISDEAFVARLPVRTGSSSVRVNPF